MTAAALPTTQTPEYTPIHSKWFSHPLFNTLLEWFQHAFVKHALFLLLLIASLFASMQQRSAVGSSASFAFYIIIIIQ